MTSYFTYQMPLKLELKYAFQNMENVMKRGRKEEEETNTSNHLGVYK